MKPRRVVARLLDRLSGLMPNVKPIVFDHADGFDWTPERQAAAQLRAEHATRGVITAGRVRWDAEPIPYTLTDKATA